MVKCQKPTYRIYFSEKPISEEEKRKTMIKFLSFLVSTAIEENLVSPKKGKRNVKH
jgi:hypothetical protein